MNKLCRIGLLLVSTIIFTTPAKAVLIGPDLSVRTFETDGAANIGWFAVSIDDLWAMPSNGSITGFQYYKQQSEGAGSDGNLHFFVVRPTEGPGLYSTTEASKFQVLYISEPITTNSLAPGVQAFGTGSPVSVQAGDIFGMFGRGVPFDVGSSQPTERRVIYGTPSNDNNATLGAGNFPITVPAVGAVLQAKHSSLGAWAANDYNWYANTNGRRTYSLAADFTPAPLVLGDFDGDGDVDGADFVAWQTNFPTTTGATLDKGDADGDSDVDGADFAAWQTSFPTTPSPGVASVPEPAPLALVAIGLVMFLTVVGYRRAVRHS
jgi:hypothetical protein